MKDLLLCKPGEIFLKGLNKHYFEERLVANVKRRLKPIGHFRVTYLQSALYIEAADDAADLDGSEKIEAHHLAEAIQYRTYDFSVAEP